MVCKLLLKKGLDDYGRAAIAQCDIEKYYDSLPVMRIAQWFADTGVSWKYVASILRHQMCPIVVLEAAGFQIKISGRSVGGLTGSRTAGMLGRIPVESVMSERCSYWRRWGFKADHAVLCAASYVDNLFSASQSVQGAISILEDFELQLESKWDLKIKPSSRSCMAAAGCPDISTSEKWPQADTFHLLGHVLHSTGSIRNCWQNVWRLMWMSFWANPGSRPAGKLKVDSRLQLLCKAVSPQLVYRCSRWPPQKMVARELDAL